MESRIKEIQEKYWAGETTIEEEKILKNYFSKNNSTDSEAGYFKHLKKASVLKPPVEFKHPGRKFLLPKWMMAAAIFVGIMGGAYLFQQSQKQNEFLVDDPQKAFEITRQALMSISSGMNKGTAYVDNLQKFEEATQLISK
ncbi:MAG: hypothetical protein K9H64_04315 [Bacteroidales bacterium]|nr:hypothetical protein [Bacteroidales bacterium]MCF8455008.1 hypothetical protein [Bacteroidales bacterium]